MSDRCFAAPARGAATLMGALHRRATGYATVAAAGGYLATDGVELAIGFSTAQLWATFVAMALLPAALIGLHGLQAERGRWPSLLGAFLYGYTFVYFAATAVVAWNRGHGDYAALVDDLGVVHSAHGVAMIVGATLFGVCSWRARVFPRWAAGLLVAGALWGLGVALLGLPALFHLGGNVLRNLGLLGMGLAALRVPDRSVP